MQELKNNFVVSRNTFYWVQHKDLEILDNSEKYCPIYVLANDPDRFGANCFVIECETTNLSANPKTRAFSKYSIKLWKMNKQKVSFARCNKFHTISKKIIKKYQQNIKTNKNKSWYYLKNKNQDLRKEIRQTFKNLINELINKKGGFIAPWNTYLGNISITYF